MQLIKEVVVDLWSFVRSELYGAPIRDPRVKSFLPKITPEYLPVDKSLSNPDLQTRPISPVLITDQESTKMKREKNNVLKTQFIPGEEAFILYPNTPCYLRPALVKDTLLGNFPYAKKVEVVYCKDDWVHIKQGGLEGWTEYNHLTKNEADVIPNFVADNIYDAGHPETLKLRTYIQDEFGVEMLGLPALNSEYVWFRMIKNNTAFEWPSLRPRTPGRWHEILRPFLSVLISKVPVTGSIVEFRDELDVSQLYYVESVAPDYSVSVTGFTGDDKGKFVVKVMNKEDWSSLDATCIIKK